MSDVAEQLSPDEQVAREALHRAFREVLALQAGKRVVFWMLEQCAIYQDAFTGDTNSTNYLLGQQASGRKLIGMLDDIDPRSYPLLLRDMADIREIDRSAAKSLADKSEEEDE